jgi:hypothetical protein
VGQNTNPSQSARCGLVGLCEKERKKTCHPNTSDGMMSRMEGGRRLTGPGVIGQAAAVLGSPVFAVFHLRGGYLSLSPPPGRKPRNRTWKAGASLVQGPRNAPRNTQPTKAAQPFSCRSS